jgi:ribonuclease R
VALDEPFVDVLVRYENFGPDQYDLDDTELMVSGRRSGDKVTVGDRMLLEITDVAILRRSVYGARIVPEGTLQKTQQKGQFRMKGALHKLKVGGSPFGAGKSSKGSRGGAGRSPEGKGRDRHPHKRRSR